MTGRIKNSAKDLYRDLVDRRLLIPAVVLVVAIVAVPIVLKTDSSAPPPLAPQADAGDATAVEAAVLTEQSGIRDYRKRLASLKARNPFEAPFSKQEGGGGNGGGGNPATAIAPPPAGSTETPIDTGGPAPAPTDTPDSTTTQSVNGGGGSVDVDVQVDEPAPNTSGDTTPEASFDAERVDVSVGPIGHNKDLEGVRPLDMLPDKQAPVAVFVGLTDGGQTALFKLSRDVTDTSGQGSCTPHKPKPCRFLTLKPGQDRYLQYEPNSKTYRLKVVDAYAVAVVAE